MDSLSPYVRILERLLSTRGKPTFLLDITFHLQDKHFVEEEIYRLDVNNLNIFRLILVWDEENFMK